MFGKRVLAVRHEDAWSVFYVGPDGKRRPATDIFVPGGVTEPDLVEYLADLCHEWASEKHPEVRRLDPSAETAGAANGGMSRVSESEREELQSWQRRMIAIFVATMAALVGLAAVDLIFGLSDTAGLLGFLALLGMVVLSVFFQFGQRCPRCGYRLGLKSGLVVPERCAKCGVGLR